MAKRFTATEIWDEDWFLEMPNEYKLFWYYLLSACSHAGIFRVNLRKFCDLNAVKISADKALELFNMGKQRVRVVSGNVWLVEDFYLFQYGSILNRANRVHKSIEKAYNQHCIDLTSIRGLKEVIERSNRGQVEDNDGVKDKDKDKDKESIKIEKEEKVPGSKLQPLGSELVTEVARSVWEDQRWRENVCMGNSLQPDELKRWMGKFNGSVCNDIIENFTSSSYKKMIQNWISSQISKGITLNGIEKKSNSAPLKRY